MRKLRLLGVLLVVAAALCCLTPLGTVYACGRGPCYWSGAVEVNDVGVEAGTAVSAWINGTMLVETTTGSLPGYEANEFFIGVPAENTFTAEVEGGGINGDAVFFKIKRVGDANWINASIDGQESAVFHDECWYTNVLLTVDVGSLNGQVHLEGREASSGPSWEIPLNVTFIQGGTEVRQVNITTNETGAFTIDNVIPGTYDIRVKNSHTLSRLEEDVVFTAGEATPKDFGTLLEGDANNDNLVNSVDFFMLGRAYNSVPGDANWDARCDFNCDLMVNSVDFFLMGRNLYQSGE